MDTEIAPTLEYFEIGHVVGLDQLPLVSKLVHKKRLLEGELLQVGVERTTLGETVLAFRVSEPLPGEFGNLGRQYLTVENDVIGFKEKFWRPVRDRNDLSPVSKDWLEGSLRSRSYVRDIKGVNILDPQDRLKAENAGLGFLLVGDQVYEECGQPCWLIEGLGEGNNQGETSLNVRWGWERVGDTEGYYAADQLEQAIQAATQMARDRGDTASLPIKPKGSIRALIELPQRKREREWELERAWRAKVLDLTDNDERVLAKQRAWELANQRAEVAKEALERLRAHKKTEIDTPENERSFKRVVDRDFEL